MKFFARPQLTFGQYDFGSVAKIKSLRANFFNFRYNYFFSFTNFFYFYFTPRRAREIVSTS